MEKRMDNESLNWSYRTGVSSAIVTVGEPASHCSASFSLVEFVKKNGQYEPQRKKSML